MKIYRREFTLQRAISTVWKIQYPLNIIDKGSLQSNKEILSEFLSKYYRPVWVFRHTEVDACQEGNEFSYLYASKLFEGYVFIEFEKIRRPREDSDLKLLIIQFYLSTVDRKLVSFAQTAVLKFILLVIKFVNLMVCQ